MAKLKKTTDSKLKFKYKPPKAEAVKRRSEQTGGRFDSIFKSGFDVYKPAVGDNNIRFLPPTWDDPEDFSYPVWVHKFVGPDNSTYLCPRKMGEGECAICEASRESKEAGEDDEAKKLQVTQQYVAWIIDRKGDEDTPLLYLISWTIDKDLAALRLNKHGGILDIANPDVGYDVSFKRVGQGLKTRYSAWSIDREETPIMDDEEEQDKILEFIQDNPVPDVLNQFNNEYLEKVMSGTSTEKDEDDDNGDEEDEKPARSKKRGGREEEGEDEEVESERRSSRKRRPEPEDESEDEESEEGGDDDNGDDNGDEEDDGRGRKARPTSRERVKSRRGEPEEEEAGEDEGEDEDAPPRRSRTTDARDVKRHKPQPEDEEDPSEDDDEENPPPRRSSKVSGKGRR
jgi:gp32 DNA binding protein like